MNLQKEQDELDTCLTKYDNCIKELIFWSRKLSTDSKTKQPVLDKYLKYNTSIRKMEYLLEEMDSLITKQKN